MSFKNYTKNIVTKVLRFSFCFVLAVPKLTIGFILFIENKKTPPFAYNAMIELFCLTKGFSNEVVSTIIGCFKRPYSFSSSDNELLGAITEKKRGLVLSELREQGYYIFEERLPVELCNRFLQFAISQPCNMRPMDKDDKGKQIVTEYNRDNPQAVRYDFDIQALLDNRDIQDLLADLSIATVAQDYLKSKPIIDVIGMWWHTSFSGQPDKAAAQYYHFDMDRPKWLKFFIYLTDVEATNGPHTFIAGSHKPGGIPSSLLKKGYARLTDEEIKAHYNEKDIVEFNAPRGTIIAEDTRGLHKGKHVQKGDRLILQIQFSNSLFGGSYPNFKLGDNLTEDLQIKIKKYPELYSAYRK